jgi:hypothetical protein
VTSFVKAFLVFTALLLFCGNAVWADQNGDGQDPSNATISVNIPAGDYSIRQVDDRQSISVEGFGRLLVPGKPNLPSRIFAIAIPPGAEVVDVTFDAGTGVELDGTYNIEPTRLSRVIDSEDPVLYEQQKLTYEANHESVYGSDNPYPEKMVEYLRSAGYRGYNLVDVRVTPVLYQPKSGRVVYYPNIAVKVTYRLSADKQFASNIVDNSERIVKMAEATILNYDQTAAWYSKPVSTRGLHDFVIITLSSLTSAVQSLVDWESNKGRTVEVVTTDWINSNYTGYDLAARIRAFLLEKYPATQWGVEDVLLVGDYDDVPMRRCDQDLGYGEPETDFYYAELSLPDDESWDQDGDHNYGEGSDQIDFYNEVNVGRIPWSDPITVAHICDKSVAFEQNDDPAFKNNMLLLGAYFWADTDNAVLMEYKVDADMHPWMADWTFTRMYEKNSYYSDYDCDEPLIHANVMAYWPNNSYSFVNWAGHGSPTSSHILGLGSPAFITSGDCSQLNDDYPSIIFADACSNSDTDYPNIGREMLGQGGAGFVGATKVALGCPAWTDSLSGSSQSFDYFFTTAVTSGTYSQGGAHQYALRCMYTLGLWDYVRYETFEWGALWGNPDLAMNALPLKITLPDGTPEFMVHGEQTKVLVQIREGVDTLVPGSVRLRYRLGTAGRFSEIASTSLGGNLFEVTLPDATCDDTLQYYFKAIGDPCGAVYCPSDAPYTLFTSQVGNLYPKMSDDFEADNGWSVTNDPTLVAGQWERGVPTNNGRGDPPADYDGSGQCYVTGNGDGVDVDGGATSLISPSFDVSGIIARVSYARWYSNETGGDPNNDVMEVYVSNNDGSSWSPVETVGPVDQASGGWFVHSFFVNDFVTPSAQTRVRFVASDLNDASTVEAAVDDFNVSLFACEPPYICGDADDNELVNISDAVYMVNYIFGSGIAPQPLEAGDVNCDQIANISDAVYLIAYIFGGGPAPCEACE